MTDQEKFEGWCREKGYHLPNLHKEAFLAALDLAEQKIKEG